MAKSPKGPSPARRKKDQKPKAPDIEPQAGFYFTVMRGRPGERVQVPIRRVIRQGTHDHGQGMVWTVEYDRLIEDKAIERTLTWIMYDHYHREWALAELVQQDAANRGKPIHAVTGRVPPLGAIP